jgi:two-component system sensor histidine kinase MtrB
MGRLFDRFFRGSRTRHDSFGAGMGLAITRGLLEVQGGSISVANAPDGGAIFTLQIPAEAKPISEVALDVA